MTESISKIGRIIANGSLDESLKLLHGIASNENDSDAIRDLNSIAATYRLMKQYALNAVEDVQRSQIYGSLKTKTFEVLSKLSFAETVRNNATLREARKRLTDNPVTLDETGNRLEWIAQEMVVDSLATDDNSKSRKLQADLSECHKKMFDFLLTTCPLSQSEEETAYKILSSSYTDASVKRIAVSAMMLAQQFVFDIRKFNVLAKLCVESGNDELRQYALVALVITSPEQTASEIYNDEIERAFKRLETLPYIKEELAELQAQMILCTDTEENNKTIANEIIPSIKESAALLQAKKTEQEMLDELLHPDKEESSMNKVEKSIEKIRDMQRKGADIFFGGFSQAKRFSFFYTLMNWFVPFTVEHPQIASINTGNIPKDKLGQILDMQPLCNSDKYSFCLTLSMVYSQIPKEVIDVISKGEAVMGFEGQHTKDNSFTRLMYLQDIYRFHKLFHRKADFTDPFASDDSVVFFNWDKVAALFHGTDTPFKIARQLLSRNRFSSLNRLLDNNRDELNPSYLKLKALSEYKQRHYHSAVYWFKKARLLEPDNGILLKRTADTCFLAEDFDRAEELYADYIKDNTEVGDTDFENYRLSICHLKNGKTDAAKTILFRLHFEHEDNNAYKSALALAHIISGDYDKAVSMYGRIDENELDAHDRVRMATVLWMMNRKEEAVGALRKHISSKKVSPSELYAELKKEQSECHLEIDDTEMKILVDIVYDHTMEMN